MTEEKENTSNKQDVEINEKRTTLLTGTMFLYFIYR
jgi:hypothetical protein